MVETGTFDVTVSTPTKSDGGSTALNCDSVDRSMDCCVFAKIVMVAHSGEPSESGGVSLYATVERA